MMKSVFLGGSRKTRVLNDIIRARIEKILKSNFCILIGDANGSDKAIQTYLKSRGYKNVIVFCSGSECRNNIGSWEVRHIKTNSQLKDFSFYTAKDKVMSEEADYGLMLWDGVSKGTLNNILNLLEQGKSVAVYFSPQKTFIDLHTLDDLKPLLSHCKPPVIQDFKKNIDLHNRLEHSQRQLSFI